MITIKLNGKEVKAEKGKTVLDVAREHGYNVPTLCHDKELSPFGSCWVCAAKVEGRRGFVTSCGTEIMDGMVIDTESQEVKEARKMALELLLSDHYADCEAPCKIACPDHVDVQTYVSLIANEQFHEATKVIKENLPMPLSIGRVCPAFCEKQCRRSVVDEPIAIRQLKRHTADFDLNDKWTYVPAKEADKGKKIAIVGGGPSGLTCGYYLSNKGYNVTVLEASPEPGGWLRYGIPEYRLPKDILKKEIDLMCKNGMKIKTNVKVGKDITLSELSKKYDAVYLGIGAQKAVPLRVKGSSGLKGVLLGVDFLKDFHLGKKVHVGKKVAVVGGGNTAIDCVRTSARLGAEVTLIYRRTRIEMPAEPYEIAAAEEEGVKFHFLTNPVETLGKNEKLKSVKFEKMQLGEPDESGRRRPMPTGEFFEENFDTIIAAVSQTPDVAMFAEDDSKIDGKEIPLSRRNTSTADERTMYTGLGNVFAGGDFRRGAATAIEAIADGRIAAESMDRFLSGRFMQDALDMFNSVKEKTLREIDPEQYKIYPKKPRINMPELEPKIRAKNFDEVEIGYDDKLAKEEAARCLECGCQVNSTCHLREYATDYKVDVDLFMGDKNKHPIDDSHPFILRDANKCIKCGRCVRICAEVQGPGVLGYIFRGFASYVAPEFAESLNNTACLSCGKCIEVCPVGALLPRNTNYKLNPHSVEKMVQNCGLCGLGCEITVGVQTDKVTVINPSEGDFNDRNLCFDGKFGWQVFEQEKRVNLPLIRKDKANDWQKEEIQWDEESNYSKIAKIIKEKASTFDKKIIYVDPTSTLEEVMMLQRVAENIGAQLYSLILTNSIMDKFENTIYTEKTYKDLDIAEAIVIVGDVPVVMRSYIRALQKKGKKLVIISQDNSDFNDYADILLDGYPPAIVLEKIIAYNNLDDDENYDPDNEDFLKVDLPQQTMFVYNKHRVSEHIIANILRLSYQICSEYKEGSGIFETSDYINTKGFVKMGIKPAEKENADFVIFYGTMPNTEQLKWVKHANFIISFNTHINKDELIDIFIPKPDYLSIQGLAIADDSRVVEFKNVKKADYFKNILKMFKSAQMLSTDEAQENYWHNNANEFVNSLESAKSYTENELTEIIESIDENLNEHVKRHYPIYHFHMLELKKKTKS